MAGTTHLIGKVIAGVDEAGRGPLAGPVVAAAVILDPDNTPAGLKDSKLLSPKRRTELAKQIRATSKAVGIGMVHEQEIDRTNILRATLKAMFRAIEDLDIRPDHVRVDGNRPIPELKIQQETIIGGDKSVTEISAASIIAKTTRDQMMISYDVLFPEYGFSSHKGYGSQKHMEALRAKGRCPIHRRSFSPVAQASNENYQYFQRESAYGRMGEVIAGMYLVRHGYILMEHGFHAGRDGEIDLIVTDGTTLSFIEVKSFAGRPDDEEALERVTLAKQDQIARVAEAFLQNDTIQEQDYRFDIMTVNFSTPKPVIKHYEEAFLPI
ncbi:MAG: ribonuclease HII [Candidatus Marinimicrobia bacterium]|nr:ribonuclease HII [Candidatus Neomarinimicrobiota bacterium]MCF7850965.1 ribonuclease HII [Candidatus Neomarinimicrobiota bacterium]